jgi:RING-box protein 1
MAEPVAEPKVSAAGGGGVRKFEVKQWNSAAFWSWDVEQECRNSINKPSIENQAAGLPAINVAWGACNHCLHLQCISRWLKTSNVCPPVPSRVGVSQVQNR